MIRFAVRLVGAVAAVAAFFAARPASAHPHIWIDATVALVAREGTVRELAMAWKFDPLFSGMVTSDFDKNGNGTLDPDEIQALTDQTVPSIAEYDYFTHLRIGGKARKVESIRNFKIQVHNKLLYYGFAIPLDPPVDPLHTELSFSLYDRSYYTDVGTEAEGAIRLLGDWPPGCSVETTEDVGNPIYFGMVFPVLHVLRCK